MSESLDGRLQPTTFSLLVFTFRKLSSQGVSGKAKVGLPPQSLHKLHEFIVVQCTQRHILEQLIRIRCEAGPRAAPDQRTRHRLMIVNVYLNRA